MKKLLFIFFISIFSITSYAQITFEKGYFINNTGEKTNCLIKGEDWLNNPTDFKYKANETSETKTATIENIKEFGVYNNFKYQRFTVDIDRSPEMNIQNLNEMSVDKNPVFNKEQLFLKALVEGKAILYGYTNTNVRRFFYSTNNSDPIPLIFKNYRNKDNNLIGENNTFRQQILNVLKCESVLEKDVKNLNHKKEELIEIFQKYNNCGSSDFVINQKKEKKDVFNLNIRLGINNSSASILFNKKNIDIGNVKNFRFGIESEFNLGFNHNKWALIAEPIYNTSYKESEVIESTTQTIFAEYRSLDVALGGRYYFFINQNSKIFINASAVFGIVLDSKIMFGQNGQDLQTTDAFNLAYGLGYKHKNFSIEFRYLDKRTITSNNIISNIAKYNGLSLILGYSIL